MTFLDLRRIGSTVHTIGSHCFSSLPHLTTIEFPVVLTCCPLTEISSYFLAGCHKLRSVDLSHTQLQKVGGRFLADCRALASVRLPPSLSTVADAFMAGCVQLARIDLRHTDVLWLRGYFMSGCHSLTAIDLPPSLTAVSHEFLGGCTALEHVDLRHTALRVIGENFLHNCRSLRSFQLPSANRDNDRMTMIDIAECNYLTGCDKLTHIDPRMPAAAHRSKPRRSALSWLKKKVWPW